MKIYIAGTGVGLGPLAFIARDAGYEVVCSDTADTEIVEYLKQNDFTVHIGQDGRSLKAEHEKSPVDWLVYSSALPNDNPELVYANEVGLKVTKRDGFINSLLVDKELRMIAVAGTHGKTNTTAMLVWCLQKAGIPISYSIGAQIKFGHFGSYQKDSKFFVYEADEYDRNFLKFNPAISLVTVIDFDHPDTYLDQMDYDQAFAQFIDQSDSVYMYADDFAGESERIHVFGKDSDEASTSLPGVYIRQNARLVLEMLHSEFDIEYSDAVQYINDFPGSSRRMEEIAENVYSDYAHTPAEISASMETAMELSDKVVVVYQPHQNIRQHEVMNAYTNCFEGADSVYWLPTYLSRENTELDVLSPDQLIENLTNKSAIKISEANKELANKLRKHLDEGATVFGMSAGDLDSWLRENFSDKAKF